MSDSSKGSLPSIWPAEQLSLSDRLLDITTSSTAFTPGSALGDDTYYWRVSAHNTSGDCDIYGDWSSVWTVTVDTTPPDPPTLLSPANGAVISDTTPALTWQASPSPDVAGYLLDWNGTVMDVGNVIQFTTGVLADDVYTWTVAAYDALHTSPYADVWSFTVDAVLPEIGATAPVNGAVDVEITAPVVITFSRPISLGTFSYTAAPDPGDWAESWNGAGTIVTLTHTAFNAGTVYTVTVTAADDLAGHPLSGTPYAWHFTTAPHRVYLPLVLKQSKGW